MSNPDLPLAVRSRAIGMLVLATAFWGLSFPLIKSLMLLHAQLAPTAGPWFITVYVLAPRFLLGSLLLAIWQWRTRAGIRSAEWKQGALIGVFSAAGMLFQSDGMQFTSASTSAFLTQFYAILIPIYVAVRAWRNPGLVVWTCCALVLAGVAILGRFDWQTLQFGRGELETIVASAFFMGQILTLESPAYAGNRAGAISLAMFGTQALIYSVALVSMAIFSTGPLGDALLTPWTSMPWIGMTLMLTVVCTIGAYGLMNAWQPKITSTEAGLVYCAEPIFGSCLALFLPAWFSAWALIDYKNETATWALLVGGGLITAANLLIQLKPPTPRQ